MSELINIVNLLIYDGQKEEAEQKAREEAERAERERQEKAKKDELERQERKKVLTRLVHVDQSPNIRVSLSNVSVITGLYNGYEMNYNYQLE